MVDLSQAPLCALSPGTKETISNSLNAKRLFHTSNGLVRDWRGLAYICDIDPKTTRSIDSNADPTGRVLNIIESKSKGFTLKNLKDAFETIERWDIVDDTQEMLEKDAELYLKRMESPQNLAEEKISDIDAEVLTIDDLFRLEQGKKTQYYDAFILYAQEDTKFANEVVENLENKHNMKVCTKDRDLIAGVSFEHKAILRLILERCNRLVLIVTPEFCQSPENNFFTSFVQAATIEKQERKIIPCVYKTCEFLDEFKFISKVYYSEAYPQNFWNKLVGSLKVISSTNFKNTKDKSKCSSEYFIPKPQEQERNKKSKNTKPAEKSKVEDLPKNDKENISEIIPDLPSLDGLSSLEIITSAEGSQTKIKKKKRFTTKSIIPKKLKTFLERS